MGNSYETIIIILVVETNTRIVSLFKIRIRNTQNDGSENYGTYFTTIIKD